MPEAVLDSLPLQPPVGARELLQAVALVVQRGIVRLLHTTPRLVGDQHQSDLLSVGVVSEVVVALQVGVVVAYHVQNGERLLRCEVAQTLASVR